MQYINRFVERKILLASQTFKVVMLTWARQIGKSTVLKHLANLENKKRTYISLDDPDALRLAKRDPELFFQQYPLPIIIDEIQYVPNLFSYIKLIIDSKDEKGLIWVTGSQNYNMMKNVQQSLAGRIGIISMFSLRTKEIEKAFLPNYNNWSFSDLKKINNKVLTINEVFNNIYIGGMPEALYFNDEQRHLYYESYINSYLMRDATEIGGVTKSFEFKIFLRSLAALTSQQINYTTLANIVGVSQNTIKDWIKLLEGLGIIYILKPYHNNELKRVVKHLKSIFVIQIYAHIFLNGLVLIL